MLCFQMDRLNRDECVLGIHSHTQVVIMFNEWKFIESLVVLFETTDVKRFKMEDEIQWIALHTVIV
jgi:hypothetical protein